MSTGKENRLQRPTNRPPLNAGTAVNTSLCRYDFHLREEVYTDRVQYIFQLMQTFALEFLLRRRTSTVPKEGP